MNPSLPGSSSSAKIGHREHEQRLILSAQIFRHRRIEGHDDHADRVCEMAHTAIGSRANAAIGVNHIISTPEHLRNRMMAQKDGYLETLVETIVHGATAL
jgi:hypothetical protein